MSAPPISSCALHPPSIIIELPVMKDGLWRAKVRHQLGDLVWLDEPLDRGRRQHDCRARRPRLGSPCTCAWSAICCSTSGVRTYAGLTQLEVTPCGAPSSAMTLDRPSRPCLAETYADLYGEARMPWTEEMLTTRPQPLAYIRGRQIWARRNGTTSIKVTMSAKTRAGTPRPGDVLEAGVVDEDVGGEFQLVEQPSRSSRFAATARPPIALGHLLDPGLVPVHNRHRGARAGQPDRTCPPDAVGAPGHQRGATLEHGRGPRRPAQRRLSPHVRLRRDLFPAGTRRRRVRRLWRRLSSWPCVPEPHRAGRICRVRTPAAVGWLRSTSPGIPAGLSHCDSCQPALRLMSARTATAALRLMSACTRTHVNAARATGKSKYWP